MYFSSYLFFYIKKASSVCSNKFIVMTVSDVDSMNGKAETKVFKSGISRKNIRALVVADRFFVFAGGDCSNSIFGKGGKSICVWDVAYFLFVSLSLFSFSLSFCFSLLSLSHLFTHSFFGTYVS